MKALFTILFLFTFYFSFGQTTFTVNDISEIYSAKISIWQTDEVFSEGWIAIYDKKTKKELFKVVAEDLSLGNTEQQTKTKSKTLPYKEQSLIIYEDFNFDGIKDFAISDGNNSCYHGPSYQIYLATNNGFGLSESFTSLAHDYCGMFEVDYEKKKIYTATKSGCCWHQYTEFIVVNNIPKPIRITEEDHTRFPYATTSVKTWNKGKMQETRETTLDLEQEEIIVILSFKLEKSNKQIVIFNYNESVLNYALIKSDNSVEFSFPIDMGPEKNDFTFTSKNKDNYLIFKNKNAEYTIYENKTENTVHKIGIEVKVDNKIHNLTGQINSAKGSLNNLVKIKSENLVFQ